MNNGAKKFFGMGKKKELYSEPVIEISGQEKQKYIQELELDKKLVKKSLKPKKESKKKEISGSVMYKTNFYAKISNIFMENLAFGLYKKYPNFSKPLLEALTSSNIRILSRTYLSIVLFSTVLLFPISFIITLLLTTSVLLGLVVSILVSVLTFGIVYSYPFMIANDRKSKIGQELVFGIVHMSAIAGSGAQPIKIFQLLVDSGDYDELAEELKRVLNYVNVFGSNLSSALKAVSDSTPSQELKEIFNGMISTIETGGDIRQYLRDKSEDSLVKFKTNQRKRIETVGVYSEVYTGFMIAGPLLFIVTFAILEKVSPVIGGIPIGTLATLGTFVLLPFLNILFILFLETTNAGI